MQNLDIDKQSIVLLTSYFKKPEKDDVNPLTPTEWKVFAGWLKDKGCTPGSLLSEDGENIIDSWNNIKISRERLILLLKRGAQMSMAIEKWSRAGIWILTRSDPDYPQKLKARLGNISPPILFGAGNKKQLNKSGIAVVGSRDISTDDIAFSQELGRLISMNNYSVISGGAKGVDESAMLGALTNGGYAIGVLADSLLQKSLSKMYREFLMNEKLVLISPYYPEAGFNTGNAMGRNKYIYCLSEAAVIVHSGLKGGTWTGANENLNKDWVPLYIKENNSKDSGNRALIDSGAKKFNTGDFDLFDIDGLFRKKALPDFQYNITTVHEPQAAILSANGNTIQPDINLLASKSMYEIFVLKLRSFLREKELSNKELKEMFQLTPAQLKEWLLRAEKDNIIQKLARPNRYKLCDELQTESDLFSQTL